jgi:transglutaminase-like putative cysteine protease
MRSIGRRAPPTTGHVIDGGARFTRPTLQLLLACQLALPVAAFGRPPIDPTKRRLELRAYEAFEQGQGAWGVRLADGGAVGLDDRVLVEDDGPGIGCTADWMKTDRAPTTMIGGDTRIKKVLYVQRPKAKEARLYVPPGVGVDLNGRALEIAADEPFPQVPVSLLRQGPNEIVLSCPARAPREIKYAPTEDILRNAPDRKDRPHRSFLSRDGGKTWQPLDGEYLVRLHLVQYVPQGHFLSPVIDLGQEREGAPLPTPVSVPSVSLEAEAATPRGTRVELAIRTGSSPVVEPKLWSEWRPAGTDPIAVPEGHRYLQWKAELVSDDPLRTPLLRDVTVAAQVRREPMPPWAATLKLLDSHNEQIRYTSIPFEYEAPLHPRMVALRRKYKLDAVVSGAASETERLVRLRNWVAQQWNYQPPAVNYPGWDADEILTRKYGYCVQYAIVMMQTAISLGHQARFVFGHNPGPQEGGHEVCEIWSNEHRKWIFFDVNGNYHYVDPASHVPMSMLEVHDLLLKTYYAGRPATLENRPKQQLPSDALAICYGTSLAPGTPLKGPIPGMPLDAMGELESQFVGGRYTVPTRWLLIHYMPRNNFYAHPFPQPKTQGCGWNWSEYWCWQDRVTPRQWPYHHATGRRSDLDWTLNQVCFDATIGERPGALAIQMGTFTPYFDTFLVSVDSRAWQESSRAFSWQLQPGRNRLEMRTRNQAGVLGPISFLEVKL